MPHYPLPTNKKKGEFNSLGNLNYMYQPVGVFIFLGFSVLAKFATWQSVRELDRMQKKILVSPKKGVGCRFQRTIDCGNKGQYRHFANQNTTSWLLLCCKPD